MFKKIFGSTLGTATVYTLIAEHPVSPSLRAQPAALMDLAHEIAQEVTFGIKQCGHTASECVAGIGETLEVRTTVRVADEADAQRLMRKVQARSSSVVIRMIAGDQSTAPSSRLLNEAC